MLVVLILIIIFKYLYFLLKKKEDFHVYDYLPLNIFYLFFFNIYILIIIRFFNREHRVFDLKIILNKDNITMWKVIIIILIVYLIIIVRKIVFLYTKITFLKVHYYLLFRSLKNYSIYSNIFYEYSTLSKKKTFFFFSKISNHRLAIVIDRYTSYILKYLFTVIIVCVIFYEITANNLIMNYSLILAPYYGTYQLIYIANTFVMNKLNFILDVHLIEHMYEQKYYYRSDYLKHLPDNLKKYIKYLLI